MDIAGYLIIVFDDYSSILVTYRDIDAFLKENDMTEEELLELYDDLKQNKIKSFAFFEAYEDDENEWYIG